MPPMHIVSGGDPGGNATKEGILLLKPEKNGGIRQTLCLNKIDIKRT